MGAYRSISVSFWTDTKVYDDFEWSDKYLYIYMLTNTHGNICGCFEISKKQISQETGLDMATVTASMDRLEKVHNVIRYSKATKELLILNWGKYNWSASDKVKAAVAGVAKHIKCREFRAFVMDASGKKESTKEKIDTDTVLVTDKDTVLDKDLGLDTVSVSDVSVGYGYGIDTVSGGFVPPSVEDVDAYCQANAPNVSAKRFVSYYKGRGWKVHGELMTDWTAIVDSWQSNHIAKQDKAAKDKEQSSGQSFATRDAELKAMKANIAYLDSLKD